VLYSKFHTNEDESSVEARGKRVRPSENHSILRSRLASHRTVSMRSDVACIDQCMPVMTGRATLLMVCFRTVF